VDGARDARLFERVALTVEDLVVGIEIVRPGLIAVPISGAVKYFGEETALLERLVDEVSAVGVECQIGVANGLFPAILAARRSSIVEEGKTQEFLAPLEIVELYRAGQADEEFIDLLRRLGIHTLGGLAALSERDVFSRFGNLGLRAHRLATGCSERPARRRKPPVQLSVEKVFDPVLERVDTAAFMAKSLAQDFHNGLASRGLLCTKLGIQAFSSQGERLSRVWSSTEPLNPEAIADRVRWQLEGWLRGGPARLNSGIQRLRLIPEDTMEGSLLQLGLWQFDAEGRCRWGSDDGVVSEKAARSLVHVQGLLGADGVFTALLDGGRSPQEQVRFVRWGDQREAENLRTPWPGRLPAPSPATVFREPVPVKVVDAQGTDIEITALWTLTASPSRVIFGRGEQLRDIVSGRTQSQVINWAGLWPINRVIPSGREGARMQVLLDDGKEKSNHGILLWGKGKRRTQWFVEGIYD
jgi:protein ImuB